MSANNVIIAVPEEELIVSLYHDYLVRHPEITNYTVNDTKFSVKAFSDYIMEYLKDYYNLDANIEEETDA